MSKFRVPPHLAAGSMALIAFLLAGPVAADDGSAAAAPIQVRIPSEQATAPTPTAAPSDLEDDEDLAPQPSTTPGKKARDPRRGTAQDPDYRKAAEMLNPLTPEQIEDLTEREEQVDRALGTRMPPAASTLSIPVTSRPGVAPTRIMLSDDYVTSLSILDSSGAAWPVKRAIGGNGKLFGIDVPDEPGNVIIVTPKQKYAVSNLLVLLQGKSVPISVALETTRESAYFNANLVVDDRGPNAEEPVYTPPPSAVDTAHMRAILDGAGAVTDGVTQVAIGGAAGTSAYYASGKFYLRTRHLLLSPAAIASISSGGVRVYEMTPSPVITVADENGRTLDLIPSDQALMEGALSSRATLSTVP